MDKARNDGTTPLFIASQKNNTEAMGLLIKVLSHSPAPSSCCSLIATPHLLLISLTLSLNLHPANNLCPSSHHAHHPWGRVGHPPASTRSRAVTADALLP